MATVVASNEIMQAGTPPRATRYWQLAAAIAVAAGTTVSVPIPMPWPWPNRMAIRVIPSAAPTAALGLDLLIGADEPAYPAGPALSSASPALISVAAQISGSYLVLTEVDWPLYVLTIGNSTTTDATVDVVEVLRWR